MFLPGSKQERPRIRALTLGGFPCGTNVHAVPRLSVDVMPVIIVPDIFPHRHHNILPMTVSQAMRYLYVDK